jgi:hypothetical protein
VSHDGTRLCPDHYVGRACRFSGAAPAPHSRRLADDFLTVYDTSLLADKNSLLADKNSLLADKNSLLAGSKIPCSVKSISRQETHGH